MIKATGAFASLLFAARLAVAQSVVAHYMAQQLYSYEEQHIVADIERAQELGIEAFVLNIAHMDYEVEKIQKVVYPAAEARGFKLLYSIDTVWEWTPADIVTLVAATAKSNATYLWDGKPLLSSFSPRDGNGNQFWADVKSGLQAQGVDVVLAPALTEINAQQLASDFPSADGFANWWAWPSDTPNNLTTTQDLEYKTVVSERSGPYIMGVSPWQFKNIGGEAWVQNSDYLYDYRWKQAINEVKPDIVEIITWNDYGESHYITDVNPIVALDPDSTKYINGVDHNGWGLMSKYYISWFKNCLANSARMTKKRAEHFPRITRPAYRDLRRQACEPTATVTITVTAGGPTATPEVPEPVPSSDPVPAPAPEPVPAPAPAPEQPAGSCDAPLAEKDVIVWYFRVFPKDITCTGGAVPRNKEFVSDSIFAWASLTAPATVRIDAGNSTGSYDLPAGPHVVGIPFPESNNETPYFQIIRDGAPVVAGHASTSIKREGCEYYDFNARVGVIDTVATTSA